MATLGRMSINYDGEDCDSPSSPEPDEATKLLGMPKADLPPLVYV